MYRVTLVLPKDMTELRRKFSVAMGEIVSDRLSKEELGYLIKKLEEQEEDGQV